MRMGRILGLMNTCARRFERRPWLGIAAGFVGYLVCAGTTWSQLPPPPPAPPDHRRPPHSDNTAVVEHLQKVRRHLEEVRAEGPDAEVLLRMARLALDGADQKRIAKDFFGADRRIEAADAFLRATGHPGHVAEGPKGPAPLVKRKQLDPGIVLELKECASRVWTRFWLAFARNAASYPGFG